jgi:hypothetical protein
MRISKASFAAGAAAALVLGSGTAFAATGGNFLLGKANTASAVTTLTNGYGTSLYLKSKTGTPSLAVNSKSKVANLNADYLDNKDISAFALSTGKTGTILGDGAYYDLDGDNVVDTVAAIAECPTGTLRTGGGGVDQTPGGTLWWSAPAQPADLTSWVVASSWTPDLNAYPDPTQLIQATVQCYNPRGAVPGAVARHAPVSTEDSLKAAFANRAN